MKVRCSARASNCASCRAGRVSTAAVQAAIKEAAILSPEPAEGLRPLPAKHGIGAHLLGREEIDFEARRPQMSDDQAFVTAACLDADARDGLRVEPRGRSCMAIAIIVDLEAIGRAVDRSVEFAFSGTSRIPDVPFPVAILAQMSVDFFLFHDPALGMRTWCSGNPTGQVKSRPDLGSAPARKLWRRRSGPRREAKMVLRTGRSFPNKESLYGFANTGRRR
jgi:hypothetical protein